MGGSTVSRRAMLAGMGVATGAVALGGPALGAAAGEAPPGAPTVKGPGSLDQGVIAQALPAVNPAYVYRTLAWHHFSPLGNPMPGVTFAGGTGMQATSNATFYCALDLPQGAVVHEAAFECYNAHPNTGLGVGFNRTELGSGSVGGSFGFSQTNAGKHTVVITNLNPFGIIDNTTYAYGLSAFLQPGTFGFFGARVAWSNGFQLFTVNPSPRKLDTRGPGPLSGKIVVGQTKVLSLTPELPAGAKAAVVNLTVAETEGHSGYVSLFPAGTAWPGTSSVNWTLPNLNIANSQTVAVSPAGAINILCGGSPGDKAHVIVDLVGYYT